MDDWDPSLASLEKGKKPKTRRIHDALGMPWDIPADRTWDPTGTGHIRRRKKGAK